MTLQKNDSSPRVSPRRSNPQKSPSINLTLSNFKTVRRSPRFSDSGGNDAAAANLTVCDKRKLEMIMFSPSSSSPTQSTNKKKRISTTTTPKTSDLEETLSRRRSPRFGGNNNNNNNNSTSSTSLTVCDNSTDRQPKKKPTTPKVVKSPPPSQSKPNKVKLLSPSSQSKKGIHIVSFFVGDPIPEEEARTRWPWRYEQQQGRPKRQRILDYGEDEEDKLVLDVKCHYLQAKVEKCIFNLGDYAYVKGQDGGQNYVGRILEFFKTNDNQDYFRVQWFFRAEDTVMKEAAAAHDKKRLFYSQLMNDNLLDCIVSKLKIVEVKLNDNSKSRSIPACDFYYDMEYSLDYSTFCTIKSDSSTTYPPSCMKIVPVNGTLPDYENLSGYTPCKTELSLLDLYSGCGGMSTGLCLGAKLSGLDVVTRWALDINKSACESLKLNHPKTQIRNESAEDFLDLLNEWDKLCKRYDANGLEATAKSNTRILRRAQNNTPSKTDEKIPSGEYEVERLIDICYSDPKNSGKRGLKFQVRWVGYGSSEDTWEPIGNLSKCEDMIKDFVHKGFKAKILPRPGDVDVVCGGPPCQGISGYNRHRNVDSPMDDERNHQIVVFMDIVNFLKPKYILMENVVDILKFAKGTLGRYALSRLVQMNYQTRLGIMAAGCYGLPQFRLRAFLWGASPHEKLPPFPLPTHDVVVRYGAPVEFERNVVAYDEGQPRILERALVLRDAISDLPPVRNQDEDREEMSYENPPETEFQKYIRATEYEMLGLACGAKKFKKSVLYDHRPYTLNDDDYLRVCGIPRRKGANFRDLPGVIVGDDNVVQRDPSKNKVLPSGRPLVPDWALTFEKGKSSRPYARLWWDETVPTVLCRPDCHSQAVLHPEQDRVLTLRESARLQGFPDYYKFCGDVKQRYSQIGNAVPVPVARALGFALGMAAQKLSNNNPLIKLPSKFSNSTAAELLKSLSDEDQFQKHGLKTSTKLLGLVCEDLSQGQEEFRIPATNLFDIPPVAPDFKYLKYIQIPKSINLPPDAPGCKCEGKCTDPDVCSCAQLNGSDFPYVGKNGGRLLEPQDVVYECGPKCGCGPACVNRTSQRGIKYHLEVFRTTNKGWAVMSWDFIPSGAPVCEYTGVLRRNNELDDVSENDYIFDIDCWHTMKEIGGRERRLRDVSVPLNDHFVEGDDMVSESSPEPDFCIDAGSSGNVARFINHSCEPNLFVQCVLSSHHDVRLARVVLFAADDILPLQELTYDYGYALDSVIGADGKIKHLPCYCGAANCRKRLY